MIILGYSATARNLIHIVLLFVFVLLHRDEPVLQASRSKAPLIVFLEPLVGGFLTENSGACQCQAISQCLVQRNY